MLPKVQERFDELNAENVLAAELLRQKTFSDQKQKARQLVNLHADSIQREKKAQTALDKLKDLKDDDQKKKDAKSNLEAIKNKTASLL
jgi:hypothetical protein